MADTKAKVFLVEDEFVVRDGIKNNVDWIGHGYEFCGEASDGELAYPMIKKLQPDIVITDIKMPFMDGLELSRLIKREFPKIEIIILSGFAEFEYAREAIKLGVAEYLNKPINGEDLLNAVDRLSKRIEKARFDASLFEKFELDNEENRRGELSKLFQYLCTSSKSISEIMKLAESLSVDLTAIAYNVILLRAQSPKHTMEEYSGSMVEVERKIAEMIKGKSAVLFDRGLEGKGILVSADSFEELNETKNSLLKDLQLIFKDYPHIKYFAGVGDDVGRISEISKSYESANRAFAYQYLLNDNMIVSKEEIKNGLFSISSVDPRVLDKVKVDEFLKTGNADETEIFVNEYFNSVGNNALESMMFRQYIALDAYFCAASFASKLGVEKSAIEAIDTEGTALLTPERTKEYILRVIKQTIKHRDEISSNRYGEIVDETVKYIEENYTNEDLSLNDLAAHVNVSPNHLSMIFSQETGSTFIKYLTDLRINKAKTLLKTTALKSSEIGNQIGYKDPHYFSFIFKKVMGMTPTQFREGKRIDTEMDE